MYTRYPTAPMNRGTSDPKRETIADPEMEDTHYGIAVSCYGEDGEMVALGHVEDRRALAAFNRHARSFGFDNVADDRSARAADYMPRINHVWATFLRPNPAHEDPGNVWFIEGCCEPGTPGARAVTVLADI